MYLKLSFLSCSWSGQVSKTLVKASLTFHPASGTCDTNWSCVDINALFLSQIILSSYFHKSELSNILQISQPRKWRLWTSQQPHGELIIYREAMIPSWNFKSQIRIVSILQSKRSVSQEQRRKVRKYQGQGSCPTSSVSKTRITDPLNYSTKP